MKHKLDPDQAKICGVCGDKASGYNFLAITCGPCKAFFRRNASKFNFFKCHFEENCEINPLTRKFCSKCRLQRCFTIGMNKERILNAEEKDLRNFKIEENRKKKTSITVYRKALEYFQVIPIDRPITDYSNNFNELEGIKLTELLNATQPLRSPDLTIAYDAVDYSDAIQAMVTRVDQQIRKVVKLSKKLEAFSNLCENDQISLLKYGVIEIILLSSIDVYDEEYDCLSIPDETNDATLVRLDLLKGKKLDLYEAHKGFLQNLMPGYDGDANILYLMLAIVLFNPERPYLIHKDVIKLERHIYMHLLQRYLLLRYRSEYESKTRFAKLLNCLKDLEALNQKYIEFYFEERDKISTPLLEEIYDTKPPHNSLTFS